MKNNKKEKLVPELRFPEFEGEWGEIELKDLVDINPNKGEIPQNFFYIDLESVSKGILTSPDYLDKSSAPSRAQRILKKDDVLFQTVRPYQKNNFYFNLSGNYVASTGYALLRYEDSPGFLYQLLHTTTFVNEVLKRSTGTNYPAINTSDLSTINVFSPSPKEQQKISSFLFLIDKKIELLKKKKELLELYKKGVMQKIFNREIRFKDKDGNDYPEWEEKRLGEILIERKEYSCNNGEFEHLSLSKEGVTPKSQQYNREFLVRDDDKKYKITRLGDICYNPANLKFGVICRNDYGEGIFSPIYITYDIEGVNKEFISILVTRQAFINKARRFEEGTVYERQAVKPADFVKVIISLPTIDEQEKIVNMSLGIETYIKNIISNLNVLKRYKNGLLQKMFI